MIDLSKISLWTMAKYFIGKVNEILFIQIKENHYLHDKLTDRIIDLYESLWD